MITRLLVAVVVCGVLGATAACSQTTGGAPTSVAGTPTGATASGSTAGPATVTVTASPQAAPSFAALYAKEQSGVVRIETVSCTESGIGTGFLLSDSLVLTVDHVVAESAAISLVAGTQRTTGTVIGVDETHDLALVRADTPLVGHHFTLRGTTVGIGDDVGAIGFPIGDPITFTRGNISGLDRTVSFDDGTTLTGLLETDAAINPGNSGGPLITADGQVSGLIEALNTQANGIAYAIPAPAAAADVARWRRQPQSVAGAPCANPLGPAQASTVIAPPAQLDPEAANGVATALTTYFDGINSGDYAAAYDVLSHHREGGLAQFADGDSTSYDTAVAVLDATQLSTTSVRIAVSFVSLQAAAKGPEHDTCDVWTLTYTMIRSSGGSWLIDDVGPYQGAEHTSC